MREPVRVNAPAAPTATLDDVDITAELRSRPPRTPNYEMEDRALALLAKEMAENPRNMLQKLVEVAVALCDADTAGISLLEGDVFRWEAVAGVFATYRNGTMPRAASPCGVCIDRNATQLMHLADRCFPALQAEPRFVEALLLPFHHQGQPVGTVWVVAHDFERKFDRQDERIMRTLAAFASAGWQLWNAYTAAEETGRRKDEFLAMLGHEIRNPLAAIGAATTILERFAAMDAGGKQAVDVLARQSRHLARMADDLLDLSRISRGKLELQKGPVEVQAVVGDALEATRPQITRRRHELIVELPDAPIVVDGDRLRLAQVLSNLLDNAAKYTPPAGKIWLTAATRDGEVHITVRDSGIGVAPGQLRSIFGLFTQLADSGDHPAGGLGLGLTLVQSLTEMHGGTVEASSDGPGSGSRFTVRLPLAATGHAPAASDGRARQAAAPIARRILVVEDNLDVAESLAMTLALDGHAVKTAHTGPAALETVQQFAPDVVLLDVGLPGLNGYEVARRMRASGVRSVIIAVSGYGNEDDRRLAREAGCDAHLVKPVDPDALGRVLARPELIRREP